MEPARAAATGAAQGERSFSVYGRSERLAALDAGARCGHNDHIMTAVGARELKMRLGNYLRQVQEGATIIVTERGRPVAELRPIATAGSEDETRLDELAALGAVQRGSGTLADWTPLPLAGPGLARAIDEDREDRF
jgi:prevent-host-death family protein